VATIADLIPGDLVVNPHRSAVFVAQAHHPLKPELALVVWHIGERWQVEGLGPSVNVGDINPSSDADREMRIRNALLIGELDA